MSRQEGFKLILDLANEAADVYQKIINRHAMLKALVMKRIVSLCFVFLFFFYYRLKSALAKFQIARNAV